MFHYEDKCSALQFPYDLVCDIGLAILVTCTFKSNHLFNNRLEKLEGKKNA